MVLPNGQCYAAKIRGMKGIKNIKKNNMPFSSSNSKSIISSSSNAGTDSLTSENSDADVRFLLRSEVNNNAQRVRHEVSLIESNHSSRNVSEDDSTSNSSGHSTSSDSDSGRTPSHDS